MEYSPNKSYGASVDHLCQNTMSNIHTPGPYCTPIESKSLEGSQYLLATLRPLKFENRLNRGLKPFCPH